MADWPLLDQILPAPTPYVFLTGKGGVGKTSLACATALALADQGKRVLLVSTDPASNLAHVFEMAVGDEATPVGAQPSLSVLNIDPEAAAEAYRERVVGPMRGVLPAKALASIEEQLSGACTTEIAAFDRFTGLLADRTLTASFDHLIFDTAPTGHTLRLLKLPAAWTSFLENSRNGASCLGPLAGLEKQQSAYAWAVSMLGDQAQTTLVLVARPDASPLREAARSSRELRGVGVTHQRLVVNGVYPENLAEGELSRHLVARQQAALDDVPESLNTVPTATVPMVGYSLIGCDNLRRLAKLEMGVPHQRAAREELSAPPLSALIDELAVPGHGLLLCMGKGGVGKTTMAAAIAVELAQRGLPVLLTTTDPAAHLVESLDGDVPGLEVERIDPDLETERYRQRVLAQQGAELDAAGKALLEEDLRSPCTTEIAVFQAFSRTVAKASGQFVIVDTAPTGHTLLLLDATGAYHREVERLNRQSPPLTPLARLQDPELTKVLLVTLAETTPVLEAATLQDDLRRAGIEPYAWIVNASLAAAGPDDPLLAQRAAMEATALCQVERLSQRRALVPWQPQPPVGLDNLRRLLRTETVSTHT